MAYSYSPHQINRFDFQVQCTIYFDMAQNAEHNARIWKAKYEALAERVGE